MAKKKPTRKDILKKPDEFLTFSNRVAAFYTTHQRQFSYLGIILAALIVISLAVYMYTGYINKKGQEAYNKAYMALTESMRPEATPQDLKEAGELFQKVIDDYGLSKAARLALPQVAYVKFLEKKYDEAIALYQAFLEEVSGQPNFEALTHLALASCYEAKGEMKKALEALKRVTDQPDSPFKESAMWSLARVYGLDNQTKKEQETLKKFIEAYPDSPFAPMAQARLSS